MNAAEFKAKCVQLWGAEWRPRAVDAFGVNDSTIDRWANGSAKIHPAAARLMDRIVADEGRRENDRRRVRKHRSSKTNH